MDLIDYQKQTKTLYSYVNPPETIFDAVHRVEEVDKSISQVNADLESRTEREMGTPDYYDDWKFRATRAREYLLREKRYLLQWIDRETQALEKQELLDSEKAKGDRLTRLVDEFLQSAPPYQPLPEAEKVSDERKVLQRREELGDIKYEYSTFLSFLRGESAKMECPLRLFLKARAPVAKIVQRIEAELREAKKTGSLESRFEHSPKPTGDIRLSGINAKINVIKKKLQMSSAEMTVWLVEILGAQGNQLPLTAAQVATLDLIRQYAALTKERTAIEFGT